MKAVIFAYHDMGCQGVQAVLDAGYEIAAIFTHADNPAENTFFGSVSRLAAELGIPVYAPDNVNHPIWVDRIAELAPDIIFFVLLPQPVKRRNSAPRPGWRVQSARFSIACLSWPCAAKLGSG